MKDQDLSPLIWTQDKEGSRYLCPMDSLSNANMVAEGEKKRCIDDDSRLASRKHVPSNHPEGKLKFSKSFSLN
jgi:hypothetical protein